MDEFSIAIYIITGNLPVRNSNLIPFFERHNLEYFIPAGSSYHDLFCFGAEKHSHIWNSLEYTCNQLAANISHQMCRYLAYENNYDWYIFLEDDAVIKDEPLFLEFIASLRDELFNFNPIAINLFPAQYAILTKSHLPNMYKALKIGDYAVGYALNKLALRPTLNLQINDFKGVADWPRNMFKLKWYAPKIPIVVHPDVHSSKYDSYLQPKGLLLPSMKPGKVILKLKMILFRFLFLFPYYDNSPIQSNNLRSRIIIR